MQSLPVVCPKHIDIFEIRYRHFKVEKLVVPADQITCKVDRLRKLVIYSWRMTINTIKSNR